MATINVNNIVERERIGGLDFFIWRSHGVARTVDGEMTKPTPESAGRS
jgi:hypothetical protein